MKEKQNHSNTSCIWCAILFLIAFGLIMILSASGMANIRSGISVYADMKKQFGLALFGIFLCFVLQYIDYRFVFKMSPWVYALGIILILLLKTSYGVTVKGATRWLDLPVLPSFQVAEFFKLVTILFVAYCIIETETYFHPFVIWLLSVGPTFLLFKISNDLSSSLVVLGIIVGLTVVYLKWEKFQIGTILVCGAAAAFIVIQIAMNLPTVEEVAAGTFRAGRIAAWIDPIRYSDSLGYQPLQSLYAIGSGKFIGKGLGNSVQKLSAIPEAHNDMIFSIICEELGLFGALIVLFLFFYLIWYLAKVAISATTLFGSIIASGVMFHIFFQVFVNIGVNTGLLPNTGIPLPFISYGGTSVVFLLVEMGLVLSVSRDAEGKNLITKNKLLILLGLKGVSIKWEKKKATRKKNHR